MHALTRQTVDTLRQIVGEEKTPLHEPYFGGNEEKYVAECVRTGWVSSVGAFVDRFESMLREITGAQHAIAVSCGTSGLMVALKLAGVEPDDEVLVPAFTFVATANAVSHAGAIPHLVDIDHDHLAIDPQRLREYLHAISLRSGDSLINRTTGRRISAMVPMHTFGHPAPMNELLDVANEFGLVIVEDAAESLGSHYRDQSTGTFGLLGVISFNGNKIGTTGGGGAILTNDADLGRRAKHLTTTAKVPHRWRFFHDEVGYNFRMPNLNAALGCAQLEQLEFFVERKRDLAERYRSAFQDVAGIAFVTEPEGGRSNYWLNAIRISPPGLRDEVLGATNDAGYFTRPGWELLHTLPMYSNAPRDELSVATAVQKSLINLPSGIRVAISSEKRESTSPCWD